MNFLANALHGGGTFLFFLLVHVTIWRSLQRKGVLLLWSLGFVVFSASIVVTLLLIPTVFPLWGSVFFYAFLLVAYTRFYITLTRTLTLRFVEELLLAPGSKLPEAEWRAIYPPSHAFAIRLQLFEEHGWARQTSGTYFPTRKCTDAGWTIQMLRSLYGIRRAG